MNARTLSFCLLCAWLFGCGEHASPTASTEDTEGFVANAGAFEETGAYGLAKPAGADQYMREFEKALDDAWEVMRDLKRYIEKGPRPEAARHAQKVSKLSKDLLRALSRLDKAYRPVRNNPDAQAAMRSASSYAVSVMARLKAFNPSFVIMINPCILPWIGDYICGEPVSL